MRVAVPPAIDDAGCAGRTLLPFRADTVVGLRVVSGGEPARRANGHQITTTIPGTDLLWGSVFENRLVDNAVFLRDDNAHRGSPLGRVAFGFIGTSNDRIHRSLGCGEGG